MQKKSFLNANKIALVVMAFVWLFCFAAQTVHAAADASLSFNPSSTTVVTGSNFSLDVMINPGTHQITSGDLKISFDSSKLTIGSISAGTLFTDVTGTNIGSGVADFSAGTSAGVTISGSAVKFATLNFTAIAAGSVTLSTVGGITGTAFYGDDQPGVNQLSSTTVSTNITINNPDITGPTFTVNDGTSNTSVKTDTINVTVSDASGVASEYYGFSSNNTCDASDTITTAFTSGSNFSIAANHSDYLCVKATDSSTNSNVSYQLVGQLHTDNIIPVITVASPVTSSYINSVTTSSSISFSLSEAIQSGTIVFTRTGGAADGITHTCTLKGAVLNSGAHNNVDLSDTTNVCTLAQSLVSGAIYTLSFNATDLAGNLATQVSNTSITFDNLAPVIAQVTGIAASVKTASGATPSYTFSSTDVGTITYGGSCTSVTAASAQGNNTVTFNSLVPHTYSDCTLQIADTAGNTSTIFSIPSFTIYWMADLNQANGVNGADLSIMHANYSLNTAKPGNAADINGDNYVNGADYSFLHAEYGKPY